MGESSMNSSTVMAPATAPARTGSRRFLIAQEVALAGAALVAAAVWLPWASGAPVTTASPLQPPVAYQISAGAVDGVLSLAPWSALMVAGVLLCCLLSIRGPRTLRLLTWLCYLLWAFVALAMLTPTLIILLTANPVRLRPVQSFLELMVTHSPRPAMLIAFLGLLLALGASALGLLALHGASPVGATSSQTAPPRKLPAAGVLTLGVALVLVGVFVMPWATVNCTQTPLFLGQCTGVNFAGAASVGIRMDANIFDPLAAHYAIPVLLAGGALLLLLGIWQRRLFRAGGLWLLLWLLTATLFAILGDAGVGAIVAQPSTFGLSSGAWSGDSGIVVAFLGLLLGWGAALYLGVLALRGRGA